MGDLIEQPAFIKFVMQGMAVYVKPSTVVMGLRTPESFRVSMAIPGLSPTLLEFTDQTEIEDAMRIMDSLTWVTVE